jgi:hypothetical protein
MHRCQLFIGRVQDGGHERVLGYCGLAGPRVLRVTVRGGHRLNMVAAQTIVYECSFASCRHRLEGHFGGNVTLNMSRRFLSLAVLAGAVICVGAYAVVSTTPARRDAVRPATARPQIMSLAQRPPCAQQMQIPFATLGRSTASMSGVERLANTVTGSDADLYLASGRYSAPESVKATQAELLPSSKDPKFHSCDLQLDDNPTAHRMAAVASAYAISHNLMTVSQSNSPSTWRMLTDDPLNGKLLVFFVLDEGTGATEQQINAAGATPVHGATARRAVLVLVDRVSAAPTNAGTIGYPQ